MPCAVRCVRCRRLYCLHESHVCNPPTSPGSGALHAAPGIRWSWSTMVMCHQMWLWVRLWVKMETSNNIHIHYIYIYNILTYIYIYIRNRQEQTWSIDITSHYYLYRSLSCLQGTMTISTASAVSLVCWSFPWSWGYPEILEGTPILGNVIVFHCCSLVTNQPKASIVLSKSLWFCVDCFRGSNVTKPKPRHRPVIRSVMTTTSVMVPQLYPPGRKSPLSSRVASLPI